MAKAGESIKTINFGVELEYTGIDRATMARAIHSVVGGEIRGYYDGRVHAPDGRDWAAVSDASIGGASGAEFVSPPCTYDDLPVIQEIVRAIRRAGGRAHESCGMHVHIDGTTDRLGRDNVKNTMKLCKTVHKFVRYIFALTRG